MWWCCTQHLFIVGSGMMRSMQHSTVLVLLRTFAHFTCSCVMAAVALVALVASSASGRMLAPVPLGNAALPGVSDARARTSRSFASWTAAS